MTSLPEQFFAARQTQLDHGFKLMRSFSEQALDRTSRVLTLQIDASRAAVEQSSTAMRQLLAVRDPRDLLTLGSQSQQQLRTLFDFSRELFSIAITPYATPLRSYAVNAPTSATPAATKPRRCRTARTVPSRPRPRLSSASAAIPRRSRLRPPLPPCRRARRLARRMARRMVHQPRRMRKRPCSLRPTSSCRPRLPRSRLRKSSPPSSPPMPNRRRSPRPRSKRSRCRSLPRTRLRPACRSKWPSKSSCRESNPWWPRRHHPHTTGPVETRGTKGRRKQT
ncbi:phasin family protein [Massilia sp. Dwa41.01b]|nr:phasin family protein [Massilia sp. Dwa41.01b]